MTEIPAREIPDPDGDGEPSTLQENDEVKGEESALSAVDDHSSVQINLLMHFATLYQLFVPCCLTGHDFPGKSPRIYPSINRTWLTLQLDEALIFQSFVHLFLGQRAIAVSIDHVKHSPYQDNTLAACLWT